MHTRRPSPSLRSIGIPRPAAAFWPYQACGARLPTPNIRRLPDAPTGLVLLTPTLFALGFMEATAPPILTPTNPEPALPSLVDRFGFNGDMCRVPTPPIDVRAALAVATTPAAVGPEDAAPLPSMDARGVGRFFIVALLGAAVEGTEEFWPMAPVYV